MTRAAYRDAPLSGPIRELLLAASDEQLAAILGSDRELYDDDLVAAAQEELDARRRRTPPPEDPEISRFNFAAFLFGPLWYLRHGMIGRGLALLVFSTALSSGGVLAARMAGFSVPLAGLATSLLVLGWCGRYGNRDLAESRAQQATRSFLNARRPREIASSSTPFVEVRELSNRMEAEQAIALLDGDGIAAMIKCEATGVLGPGTGFATRGIFPAKIFVPEEHAARAGELLDAYFETA